MGAATQPSLTTTSTLTWQLACLPTAPQYWWNPHRVCSLFHPSGFVHHPSFQGFQVRDHLLTDGSPQGLVTPRTAGQQLLQALRVYPHTFGQGLDRLALPRHEQPFYIMRGSTPAFTATQTRDQSRHKLGELRNAILPETGIPFHALSLYKAHFRAHLSAAPLKRLRPGLGAKRVRDFRAHLSAAPLKNTDVWRQGHKSEIRN